MFDTFAGQFAGVPSEEMRGSSFTVIWLFTMVSLAVLFPCAVSSSAVSIYVVNSAGKGQPPSCVFMWHLIPGKPDNTQKLSFPSQHFNTYKEVFQCYKVDARIKILGISLKLTTWLPSRVSVLSAARQLAVEVFIKAFPKACFFKIIWIRSFSSPATWIYQHLRGIVRITLQQKLLVSLLTKWY